MDFERSCVDSLTAMFQRSHSEIGLVINGASIRTLHLHPIIRVHEIFPAIQNKERPPHFLGVRKSRLGKRIRDLLETSSPVWVLQLTESAKSRKR
jgi:hypothetical protein